VLAPVLLLCGLVAVRWPTDGEVDVAGARSRELFRLIGFAVFVCVAVLSPAFPAASLVRERRQGTLALLLRTPVTRPGIYAGKFLALLTCALLPLALSFPAVAACYAMGGIDLARDVAPLYLVLLLTLVECIAASLWVSRFASTTSAAVRGAYALVFALVVVVLAPSMLAPPGSASFLARVAGWLRDSSPLAAVVQVLDGPLSTSPMATASSSIGAFVLAALVLTVCFAAHTIWSISPSIFDRSRATGPITQDQDARVRSLRRIMFILDPRRRSGVMPNWVNPVLIKELRSRRFGRGHWMVRLVAICAIVSLALTYVTATGAVAVSPESIGALMVLLQTALLIMITPSLASGIISEERESGGWTLLCLTPLSMGRIVRGKLLSVAWTLLLILLATLPGYAVMVWVKPVMLEQVRGVLLTLTLIGVLAVCVSGAVSAFSRRTAASTLGAYVTLIVLLGSPFVVWLGRDAPFGRQTVERALAWSPVAAALHQIRAPGFETYQILPMAWWVLVTGIVVSALILWWKTLQLTRPV